VREHIKEMSTSLVGMAKIVSVLCLLLAVFLFPYRYCNDVVFTIVLAWVCIALQVTCLVLYALKGLRNMTKLAPAGYGASYWVIEFGTSSPPHLWCRLI
jgi:hypothetical protein